MKNNLYGKLSQGCKLCLSGQKFPVYVSFLCNKTCYYCPILPSLTGKDLLMVGENKFDSIKPILNYVKKSSGLAISGGEPLLVLDRVLNLIKFAKKEGGEKFHIHMYTNAKLLTTGTLSKLVEAGLDEIRIHSFDLDLFRMASNFDIAVGSEFPCPPNGGENIINFIRLLDKTGTKFVNVNEMQSSKQSFSKIKAKGFDILGNRVVKSEETALNIIKILRQEKLRLSVHYCSIKQEIDSAKMRLKRIGV